MKYNQGGLHPSGDYIQQERGIRFRLPLRLLPASGRCHSWQHLPQHSRHIHTNHRFPKMSVGGSLKERFCSKIDFFLFMIQYLDVFLRILNFNVKPAEIFENIPLLVLAKRNTCIGQIVYWC